MRVTRLVNSDAVLDTPRIWVLRRWGEHSKAAYFVTCPWCVSMWAAAVLLPFLVYADHLWAALPLAVLAASHLTGLAAQLDGSEVEIEIREED